MKTLQLAIRFDDRGERDLQLRQLRAGNDEVGIVGRPIVAPAPAMPASCAASASSISCRALPRTSTTSGLAGEFASGA